MSNNLIAEAIEEYAKAYERLQSLQETEPSIPEGDQKTGCIGEYYSYRYLSSLHSKSNLEYGSTVQAGWDIKIVNSGVKVQVKTVSAYSKTKTISPIHRGWDILHLVYLSRALWPEGFWVVTDNQIFGENEFLAGKKCRVPDDPNSGSSGIPFGENKVSELLRALTGESA